LKDQKVQGQIRL